MILIKSILAGLGLLILAAFLWLVGAIVAFNFLVEHDVDTVVAIDPISVVRNSPRLWVLAGLIFTLGFFRKYRRVKSWHLK